MLATNAKAGLSCRTSKSLTTIRWPSKLILQILANLVLNQYWQLRLWGTTGYSVRSHFAKRMAYGPVETFCKTAVFRLLRLLPQNCKQPQNSVFTAIQRKTNFIRCLSCKRLSLVRDILVRTRQSCVLAHPDSARTAPPRICLSKRHIL